MINVLHTDVKEKDVIDIMNTENVHLFKQNAPVRMFSMNGIFVTQYASDDSAITLVDRWRLL